MLVTGATGFIGSYLIPALLERGHSVLATDVVAEAPQLIQDTRIDYLQADLTQEADVRQLFDAGDIDWVIHLAALLAEFCEDDPARGYRVNVMGTLALLDTCVARSVGRFVMTSTSGVFGRGLKEPVADDAQKVPENIYGQTKLACEHILGWFHRQKGLSVGAVRFPWVYGPGRKTGITADFSSKLLDRIARGEDVVIETPKPVGDWLYVKDAARALILLAERQDAPNTTYNIMGSVHSVAEAMEIACELYPRYQDRNPGKPDLRLSLRRLIR